jgi:hypothetical protein
MLTLICRNPYIGTERSVSILTCEAYTAHALPSDLHRESNRIFCFICCILRHQVWQIFVKAVSEYRSSRVSFCLDVLKDH